MCFLRSSPVGKMMEHSEQISAGSFNFLVLLFDTSSTVDVGFLFNDVATVLVVDGVTAVVVSVERLLRTSDCCCTCCCCCSICCCCCCCCGAEHWRESERRTGADRVNGELVMVVTPVTKVIRTFAA